jgi:hypothetical protein
MVTHQHLENLMALEDERKEVRSQRHDFIKEYYKMAVSDLDRHLKAGWQTIAVLAGGAAILTAGHDAKIGFPIAIAMAVFSAVWGALTVIDANYWSLRAIGFLANVEAVYFSAEDRKHFNPYAGLHPPYKLLDSLRYMFWLCLLFGGASLSSMIWEIAQKYPTLPIMWDHFRALNVLSALFWTSPVLVGLAGAVWMFKVWKKRMNDYIEFSENSPGPGMVQKSSNLRHVTFEFVGESSDVQLETGAQNKAITDLKKRIDKLNAWTPRVYLCALVLFATTLLAAIWRF